MRRCVAFASLAVLFALTTAASAQENRPASPRGSAQTQVGGTWKGDKYEGGKWIEIDYGRPIKRQRQTLFGAGPEYGAKLSGGAPVWRAGANQTSRLHTEVPLTLGGKKLAAGDYSLFIELKENGWTLILSTQEPMKAYDPKEKKLIWGSYGYDAKQDVLRAPMKLTQAPRSVDQLTMRFLDVTEKGGTLEVAWDTQDATVDFTAGG